MADTKHAHHFDSEHPPPVTSVLSEGDLPEGLTDLSDDEAALASLGYKQEFKREFSLWTTFCVSFAVRRRLAIFQLGRVELVLGCYLCCSHESCTPLPRPGDWHLLVVVGQDKSGRRQR